MKTYSTVPRYEHFTLIFNECTSYTLDSTTELSRKKDFALISKLIAPLCVNSHK